MISAITSDQFTSWDDIRPARWGLNCMMQRCRDTSSWLPRTNNAWEESGSQWTSELLCCATHTSVIQSYLSSSILYVLHHWVIRAQGWWMGAERSSFHASSQACVPRTRSPAAINLVPWTLKPASNNATALQTKGGIRSVRGRRSRRGSRREKKENKLFTLTSNVPQRVVKRKGWASVVPVWAPTDGKWAPGRGWSESGGWANAQGRKERITSSSSWFHLIYVTSLKTLGTNKIAEDHFGSKSKTYYCDPHNVEMAEKHAVIMWFYRAMKIE